MRSIILIGRVLGMTQSIILITEAVPGNLPVCCSALRMEAVGVAAEEVEGLTGGCDFSCVSMK
jgi:hypothetical protein